jgi:hypothetical protein
VTDDYRPSIVADHPELPFGDIPRLTREERVIAWLRDQEDETVETIIATLFLTDGESRRRRAERWFEIRSFQARYDRIEGWLIPGGVEAFWLYEEACRSYANGRYLAALLCAHSACERVLAGCLLSFEAQLPPRWQMWGLGNLVPEAFRFGLIDAPLKDKLHKVSELRKVSAHFKPPLAPNSITRRVAQLFDDQVSISGEDEFDTVLRTDAMLAIETSTELLRGDQGFSRIKYFG